MKTRVCLIVLRTAWPVLALLLACGAAIEADGAERAMRGRLVWGTNHQKPNDPSLKNLDGALATKLKNLPLKFTNYFEVRHVGFAINDREYTKVEMSKKCYIEVKDKGGNLVTVKLYGEGKPVSRVDQTLPKGETLAIAGNAEDGGAWLVIVEPVEPKK
jgi:hypothetical protein